MRNEEVVKKLIERHNLVKQERESKIVYELCELILSGVEKLLDKKLTVFLIVFQKNIDTDCIDIVFKLEQYENIVKSIENRKLLRIPTEIRYYGPTLECCHNWLASWGVVKAEINSGDYKKDEVSFKMIQ